MTKKHDDEYDEMYNETSNTAAGINTPKDHECCGPLDMISGAVGEIVDNVQHTFDVHQSHAAAGDLDESDESDYHAHLNQHESRYDRHSY